LYDAVGSCTGDAHFHWKVSVALPSQVQRSEEGVKLAAVHRYYFIGGCSSADLLFRLALGS
jgi:hypothetical protein